MASEHLTMPPDEPLTPVTSTAAEPQTRLPTGPASWPPPGASTAPGDTTDFGNGGNRVGTFGSLPRGSWALMFASALLGAVLGGVLTSRVTPNYEAVALVQGAPARLDPSSLNQEDDRYAQTEAAYAQLAEPEINAAIAERTDEEGLAAAEVSLVAGTTIMRFTGSGDTAQAAADAANISAETYVELWRARSATALTESLALVNQNITVPADPNSATADTNSVLAEQRAVLDTQLAAVQSMQRVVKPAAAETAEKTAGYTTGVILGGLLGLTVGVGVPVWRRRPERSAHPNLDQVAP